MARWMRSCIKLSTCFFAQLCDRGSSMQQNLYSVAHNGATNVQLTQETQQTYHDWSAAQSGATEGSHLHQPPQYNSVPIPPSGTTGEVPHYNGQTTSPSSLANAPGNVPSAYLTHPITVCQWQGANGMLCNTPITHAGVPHHFKRVHEIKDMKRNTKIKCRWLNCQSTVVRHNFVRHLREAHLGNKRRKAAKN